MQPKMSKMTPNSDQPAGGNNPAGNNDKTFTVTVDGDEVVIPRKGVTPADILTAAGLDPAMKYLIEVRGNKQISYRENPNEEINVNQNQQFLTGALGPVPVS